MAYNDWENTVVEVVAEALGVGHSDACGVVEAQPFHMQQAWGKGLDAPQTADIILAATQVQ